MSARLTGKVLITGGTGFLARAIYRRARRESWTVEFTSLSRDDHKAVAVERRFPEVRCLRGDVAGSRDALVAAFRGHDIVLHCAASKHVDRSEYEVRETLRVNVEGSINVAYAAIRAGIQQVIGISTDKAARPFNTYGITKALMERAFQEFDTVSDTEFRLTRYGNVVASTGSVLTLFRKQVEDHGHLRLTDPEMTRFWMRADEAVDAVLRALDVPRGCTWIPACGAMRLRDLAACAAPGAPVEVIGVRPGEKTHETLLDELEGPRVEWVERSDPRDAIDGSTGGFCLRPMAAPAGGFEIESYSSDDPLYWWTCEAMLDAIADAEEV